MSWYVVTARGARADLWLEVTGEGKPEYGVWETSTGLRVRKTLGEQGPGALDIKVRWQQDPDHSGAKPTDMLWEVGGLALKVVSTRMCALLQKAGANLDVFDVEVRLKNGEMLDGFVGVLERTEHPGVVHSLWRSKRSNCFVVSDAVMSKIKAARLTGLDVQPTQGPFPGDQPGFFDDDDD